MKVLVPYFKIMEDGQYFIEYFCIGLFCIQQNNRKAVREPADVNVFIIANTQKNTVFVKVIQPTLILHHQ